MKGSDYILVLAVVVMWAIVWVYQKEIDQREKYIEQLESEIIKNHS